jgi:hypothetical protein
MPFSFYIPLSSVMEAEESKDEEKLLPATQASVNGEMGESSGNVNERSIILRRREGSE